MTDAPNLRARALDAAAQALNAGGYWLPTDGQAAVVDAVLAITLATVVGELRGQADHHEHAAHHAAHPELADGFLAAASHVHTMNRPTT